MARAFVNIRAAWTIDAQGKALRRIGDGACVFLGPRGCEVHPDCSLVCRIYLLGRHLRSGGFEYYTTHKGHPQSDGEFANQGTVTPLQQRGAPLWLSA
jgi:hypothetical protein